ncbi:TPR-like protein [Phlegmacium glaucopus]|nr:TPR-like protein [Phlegmacium glaucopus]
MVFAVDTPAEHVFNSVKEGNSMAVKMTFTVASSSTFGSGATKVAISDLDRAISSAEAFQRHFEETGNIDDITQAISHYETAVSSIPSVNVLPAVCNNLGNLYLYRFECTGDFQDIDHAISHHQNAVQSTPPGDANLLSRFNNLGNSYLRRSERTGDLQDIDHAISYYQNAVESTPSGDADLPSRFNDLGISYICRFECTGDLQDIEHAISHHRDAVESTPSGHPDLPSWFNNLGNSYLRRFECTGDLLDINYVICHHQTAVESTPSGHPDLPSRFNNLGSSYLSRFERTSNLQDIDFAISHHQTAVESTPSGHAVLPSWFNNLGNSYLHRFKRTSDLQDIDHAISYLQSGVESTPSGHANLPSWFNNLGTACALRFECTKDLQDIDRAISYHQSAVESTPSGHANLPSWSNNLGTACALRFECTKDLQDIDRAISYHQSAVESTPSGHANLPRRFDALGTSYSLPFESTGNLQDIDRGISYHQNAVETTPPGHALLSLYFKNLGKSYSHRFQHTNYSPDVQNSIASYRRAAEANGAPPIRLESAILAATLSSIRDDSHCLIDFALAISLLSEVAGLEQMIHRRHANLHDYSDLVGSAVATALRFNKADLALEWLEQGRCLVWNQLNQLRTPVDDLRWKNPSLADRFIQVASALESYGTRSALSIPSSHATLAEEIHLHDATRNHTLHATEHRRLLQESRDLPGFDDFLQPPKASDILSSLPSDGPVIIFNIHKTRCDALALIAGIEEPLHIPLERFSLEQAEQLQKTLQFGPLKQREVKDHDRLPQRFCPNPSSMSLVLNELWCKVVQPILKLLGYLTPPNLSDRRRIWWCPTGPLVFLPLHAAGVYGSAYERGSCISDFVVSSYTPNVRSLNDKFIASSASSRCNNLVLISQPNTPGLPPIPSTRKETHALEALMKGTAINTLLLEDSEATIEKVKAEMKSHSWVHFACHGVQNVHQPLESGLCLHDGRLELLEIMRQQIPNADFAFLSASETSKGDHKLPEEVVHFTAGMLAAGYRGVVGTMWSLSDVHGPKLTMEFYQYLLREKGLKGLDSTRAAYALDYATRKLRESLGEGDTALLAWVPYVHWGY